MDEGRFHRDLRKVVAKAQALGERQWKRERQRRRSKSDELQVLCRLATEKPRQVANSLGMSIRGLHRWTRALADDLDAAGFNGSALRLVLRSWRQPSRPILFPDLDGAERRSALRQLTPADLAPPRFDPRRVALSRRAIGYGNLWNVWEYREMWGQP